MFSASRRLFRNSWLTETMAVKGGAKPARRGGIRHGSALDRAVSREGLFELADQPLVFLK